MQGDTSDKVLPSCFVTPPARLPRRPHEFVVPRVSGISTAFSTGTNPSSPPVALRSPRLPQIRIYRNDTLVNTITNPHHWRDAT
jgi:hypothetical protein